MARPIPAGFSTVTPIFVYKDCPKALAFYEKAFGVRTRKVVTLPDGKVVHAELELGDSVIILTDELSFAPSRAPRPGCLTNETYVYVPDADAFIARAAAAGATVTMPCRDMFYGDRVGAFEDPFGYHWTIATHVEDVPEDVQRERLQAWVASGKNPGAG